MNLQAKHIMYITVIVALIAALPIGLRGQPALGISEITADGNVELTVNGEAGQTYVVEATSDFESWTKP